MEDTPKYEWQIDAAIATAKENGFTVIQSDETSLLLDLDDAVALDTYTKMVKSIGPLFQLVERERWVSKSGKGIHVVLSCKPLGFAERVALQACLGSDKIREALAIGMVLDGHLNPSVLFKPSVKGAAA